MSETASRALTEPWRKREGGGRGQRVPKEFWEQAIVVARVEGLQSTMETMGATRFNYDRLKQRKRISDANEAVRDGVLERPAFVCTSPVEHV